MDRRANACPDSLCHAPAVGFEVLREVSQHTNTRLHAVTERVLGRAAGEGPLPPPVDQELKRHLDAGNNMHQSV
ncbi:hypothetical protein ACFVJ4_42320 [Streptomyces sp. NPDC127178]|uniref:hypothetical protein n=1 Tax=unclassified Streptomyces TaxID=2593676 RepID=UPI00362E3CDB